MIRRSIIRSAFPARRPFSSSITPLHNFELQFQFHPETETEAGSVSTETGTDTETGTGTELHSVPPKPTPPPPTPCPLADTLSHLLISHHNPFHPSESPLQLSGVGFSNHLLTQTLLRLRNHSKPAFSLFLWARDHFKQVDGGRVSDDAYDLVIDSLGRVRQFDAAWRILVEMGQDGVGLTSRTFAVMIRRHVAAGLKRQAVRAFDDMEAFIGREPNKEEFCTLLDTLCKYKYSKIAMELFNK